MSTDRPPRSERSWKEAADLYGALEAVVTSLGVTMEDITKMSEATKRAFVSGQRKQK